MSVRIRLRRMGRKKQAHFRVVVADRSKPRDGRIVEQLGYYRPLSDPARLVLDLERVDHWLSKGALASDTVNSLINKARRGGDDSVAVGEPDLEEERAKKAEALAAKRRAEREAAEAEEEAEEAEEEAEAAGEEPEAEAATEAAEEDVAEEAEEEEADEAEAEAAEEPDEGEEEEEEAEAEAAGEEPEASAEEEEEDEDEGEEDEEKSD